MKYAIIRTGGKQYKINEGDIIDIERLADSGNKSVTFSEVLMTNSDGEVQLGQPILSGVTVSGTVLEDIRGEKIRVAKYKAKVRYRRVTGHRQALSRVKIDAITINGAKKTSKSEKIETANIDEPKTEKKATVRARKAPVTTS